MKTKQNLIDSIEAFINSNLNAIDIQKGQGRIDWKEDQEVVFQMESDLYNMIAKLQDVKLEDIK